MKKCIFLILCTLCSLGLMAQNKMISGIVTDVAGETIIGASVIEANTTNGTITDINGRFSLQVSSAGKIQITYIGYQSQTVDVKSGTTFTIKLKEDSKILEEVVVTGYGGKQLRTKVTNSISKVKEDVLQNGLFSNPAQALSGAVAGLQVQQTSGNPGSSPTLILRGGTNFNGSGSPLILIDGQVRSSLSDINPDDIESMEVLKDAGATAIYGARANDGVVLVTTKRGKAGKAEVSLKAKLGLNYFQNSYEFMGAGDYLYWMRTAYKNADYTGRTNPDGSNVKAWSSLAGLNNATPYGTGNKYWADDAKTIPLDGNKSSNAIWSTMNYTDDLAFLLNQGWSTMIDPVYGGKLIYKNTDIADFNIKTPTFSQDYNVSVSGGNDKGSYYAGIGYNKSEGTAINNWYQRITFTFNADYKIKEWLTSNSSFNFADAVWYGLPASQTAEANYFSRSLSLPPTFRGYNADGEALLGPNSSDGNQQYNIDKFIRDNNTDKFTMGQSFKIDLMKGLSMKLGTIWYYSEEKYESFNKDYLSSPGNMNTSRSSSASYGRTLDQTYNAVLNYDYQLTKDHYLAAMVGFEYYDTYYKGFSASGSGAPTDDFGDLGFTSTLEGKRSIDSSHNRNRIMSFFGRVNYDFQSKYLFSFVMRKDGYSKLAKENRWGVFPGVSGGWVFGKESFMEPLSSVVSFAKLRGSYGLNGNVSKDWVGNYTVQGSYGSNKYNGNTGFLIGGIPNPYLTWEKSKTFEIGLDLSFLENKISSNLTYYNRRTSDKFANITVPSISGVSSVVSNNGEFQNQGFEFDLGFKIFDKKDWKWNVNWNGALNINKVTKLPTNGLDKNRQNAFQVYSGQGNDLMWVGGYQEGQRPGDLYMFVAEGIYKTKEEIPSHIIDITSGNNGSNGRPLYGGAEGYNKLTAAQKEAALPIEAGDVRWKDVNGDGVIDNYDLVKVGNYTPKWTGGINTSFSWKDLRLSARFDYALGFMAVDWKTPWIMGNMQGTYNSISETRETWTPESPNAQFPKYVWADQLGKRNYARNSSMFAYKGDYIAFRELSLAYKLPELLTKKAFLNNVELSVTGQNLGYLTASKHLFSPEKSDNNGGYPLPLSVIFGVNISF